MERIPAMDPRWYAVMTTPQQESTAAAWLMRAGYHCAYPFDRHQIRRNLAHGRHRIVWVEKPHFPRYIFVALTKPNQPIGPINAVKGVSRLVTRPLSGVPLQIPTAVMDLRGDNELRVFVNQLGKWKCERAVA